VSDPAALRAQQLAAADPSASVWVAASAGTGKTHLLTNRVLRLLLAGSAPERLLCLTFTKAAAAEMANRIHTTLGAWTALGDGALGEALHRLTGRAPEAQDLARARRLFAEVLETPGGLKVQTIHAFCESLLRRFPLEAGLPPHFQVVDERTADELLVQARDQVLARDLAGPTPLAPRITRLVDDEAYTGLMKALVAERGRFARMLADGGIDGAIERLQAQLSLAVGERTDDIVAAAAREDAFDAAGLRRVAEAMLQAGKTDQENGRRILDWLAAPGRRAVGFEAYCRAYFTQKNDRRSRLIGKQALASVPDGEEILAVECERLSAVENRRRAAEIAAATETLIRLGASLVEAYARLKAVRALVDYDDLILRTRALLHRPEVAPWVLYKLDGGLDHILVDEAQDTNPEQWQVIAALAEEFFAGAGAREELRTVFAVGDAKQSIFSFQRADPEAFERMRAHFAARVPAAGADWRPVELALSYRSAPAVLQAIDRIFAPEAARDGLVFGDGEIRHVAQRSDAHGLVELWPTETPRPRDAGEAWRPPVSQEADDSPMGRLAARIAETIGGWLERKEVLLAQGRPIRPGDIMILVQRRRPFLDEMVRRLKQAGIPVAGADRMILSEQIAVMDLIALGRFLLLPEDDLTLAVVLKSPLIGFDEESLFRLAHGREAGLPLWQALRARRGEQASFEAAYARLEGWLEGVDFAAPFDFYARLLAVDGGRRQLLGRLGAEAGEAIDEFLDLALDYERTHPPSLQGFLAWIEAGEAEVKRDLEQQRDEVRVMTVHGAKGLQAEIVILADTVRVPQQVPELLWHEDEGSGGSFLWRPHGGLAEPVSEALRDAAIRRRDQEYRRLFYVALTRAADRLYIAGWETTRGRKPGCWYELALAAMSEIGEEVALAEGRSVLRLESPQRASRRPEAEAEAGPEPAPAPAWLSQPAPAEPRPPRPLAPSRPEFEEPPVRRPLAEDAGARFRRGLLLHRLLQYLPELPAARRRPAAAQFLEQAARGLDAGVRRALAAEALAVLEAEAFAPLFQPGSRAEAPLAGRLGQRIVSGQVDRLLVGPEEVLIVDYKSNRPAPDRSEDCPPAYLAQMAAYRELIRSIYPDRRVRCALLWTEVPRLMALSDELLDRHAP